jgi:hypothetical protein
MDNGKRHKRLQRFIIGHGTGSARCGGLDPVDYLSGNKSNPGRLFAFFLGETCAGSSAISYWQ